MKGKTSAKTYIRQIIATMAATILFMIAVPVFAWFSTTHDLAAYAPVSTPESLYIGAGHCERNQFEDIRYMYFDAMDVKEDVNGSHWDRVFCVYGKRVSGYRLQLAFTTNKQFTYEIYNADEYTQEEMENLTESERETLEPVAYTTHAATPATYYYSIKIDPSTEIKEGPLSGTYLNKAAGDEILADMTMHGDTYGSYNDVHKYAEPVYWQTTGVQAGNVNDDFVNYYILRIRYKENEMPIDRETDVICIAAKSFMLA